MMEYHKNNLLNQIKDKEDRENLENVKEEMEK